MPALFFALELPIFIHIEGANALIYHPQREPRSLKWDECYKMDFGFEPIRHCLFDAQLHMQIAQYLDSYQPYIHTMEVGISKDKHRLALGISAIGIAKDYWQNSLVHYPARGEFLFENQGLNALSYTFMQDNLSLKAALGGNKLSQAISLLQLKYVKALHKLQIDFRSTASDAHWHNPSMISHLGYTHQSSKCMFQADLMHKHVFSYNNKPKRDEYAYAIQASYQLLPQCDLKLATVREHRAYPPANAQEYHITISKKWDKLSISPYLVYRNIDECVRSKLLAEYELHPQARLGIAYGLNQPKQSKTYHELIIQADLAFAF